MAQVRGLYPIRLAASLSLKELARRIRARCPDVACSHSVLSRFENMQTDSSVRTLAALAAELGVSIDALLTIHEIEDTGKHKTSSGWERCSKRARRVARPLLDQLQDQQSRAFLNELEHLQPP